MIAPFFDHCLLVPFQLSIISTFLFENINHSRLLQQPSKLDGVLLYILKIENGQYETECPPWYLSFLSSKNLRYCFRY